MKTTKDRINAVLKAKNNRFVDLARIAKMNPARDFCYANLKGVDFSNCDLSDFVLHGSNIANVKFFNTIISRKTFDDEQMRMSHVSSSLKNKNIVFSDDVDLGFTEDMEKLFEACLVGSALIAAQLIESGIDLNKHNSDGQSPLFIASQNGHYEVVKTLIEHGVDVNQQSIDVGLSALMIASQNGHYEVVKALIEHGADFDQVSIVDGMSALDYARENGNQKVVNILKEYGAKT